MKSKFDRFVLTLVLVLTLAAFSIPTAAVSADPGDTPPQGDPANPPADLNARLERTFARQQKIQTAQEGRLERMQQVISKTQAYIEAEQAAGYDTSKLEAGLEKFQAAYESNAALSAASAELIAAHEGFDDQGKVTDTQEARQTVKEIGKNQRKFHLDAVKATLDLRKALREYRELNHPRPTPEP